MKNLNALIVDDSIQMASVLSVILRDNLKFGAIYKAKTGEQALQTFKNESVDWIFSEADLPGMSGLDLLNAVRALDSGKSVHFVVVTSLTDKETIEDFLSAGASDIIAKPFNITTVTEKILGVHHRSHARDISSAKSVMHETPIPKPVVGTEAGPRRNRRVVLKEPFPCRVSFNDGGDYASNMLNISLTGGLVRCEPFKRGGAIYDVAELALQGVHAETILIKAMLIRMTVDQKNATGDKRAMLAAFRFQSMDEARRDLIKALLIENARAEGHI